MSNRTTNGDPATGAKPPDDPPETMEVLLERCNKDWKLGMKDRAFQRLLTAVAMISQGTAEAMKTANQALQVSKVALDNSDEEGV